MSAVCVGVDVYIDGVVYICIDVVDVGMVDVVVVVGHVVVVAYGGVVCVVVTAVCVDGIVDRDVGVVVMLVCPCCFMLLVVLVLRMT